MPERTAKRGKGDPCVAAGCLGDAVAGLDSAFLIRLAQNVEGHAILDIAGRVVPFRFCKDAAVFPAAAVMDFQKRGVADQGRDALQAAARFQCHPKVSLAGRRPL